MVQTEMSYQQSDVLLRCADISGFQRMKLNDFGDPLILSSGTMRSTFGGLSQQILHGSWSFVPSVKNKTYN